MALVHPRSIILLIVPSVSHKCCLHPIFMSLHSTCTMTTKKHVDNNSEGTEDFKVTGSFIWGTHLSTERFCGPTSMGMRHILQRIVVKV